MTQRGKENWEKIYRTALFGVLVFFGTRTLNSIDRLQDDVSGLKADMLVLKTEANNDNIKYSELKNDMAALEKKLNDFIIKTNNHFELSESN